jgi:hypothetical protein
MVDETSSIAFTYHGRFCYDSQVMRRGNGYCACYCSGSRLRIMFSTVPSSEFEPLALVP